MSYTVTLAVSPPRGAPPLDELLTEGLAAIIGRVVDNAQEAIAADGSHVGVIDRWVGCHPEGAVIALVLSAAAATHATDAARALIDHAIQSSSALTGWTTTVVRPLTDTATPGTQTTPMPQAMP